MPLLEMKSKLSQINTNFGSDTTTAGNTTSFSYDSLFKSTPPSTISIGWSTTPISDYVSAYSIPTIEEPTTNTTTTTIQAQTQQESGNLFAGGIPPVNVTLTQPLTTSTPSKTYNPSIAARRGPSPLLQIHKEGREANFGFTNYVSWNKLDDYYNQLTDDTGMLGIRNDNISKLGAEHPYIIREIGDRWGVGMAQTPTGLTDFAKQAITFGVNVIDDLGEAIIGREPTVFTNRYLADVQRLSKAANPALSIFALKQDVLHKGIGGKGGNPFETVTTVRYGLEGIRKKPSGEYNIVSLGESNAIDSAANVLYNPRIYNPLSIYSAPGIYHINRLGKWDIGAMREKVFTTIADYVSDKALELAQGVGDFVIELGSRFIDDMQPIIEPIGNMAGNAIKQLRGIKIGKAKDNNTAAVHSTLGDYLDNATEAGSGLLKSAKAFGETLTNEFGTLSKAKANQLNIDLSGVGVDKVNLIPYGTDKYGEGANARSAEELDFIPFKFKDTVNDKYIVFRALLSGITDTFTPEYSPERYVGRPDNVYVYQGTTREITFTFDVYPKSDQELVVLWDKLNYLAGLTYPTWTNVSPEGGSAMIAPFSQLTIGQMYTDAPGYISNLTYTVMDDGTWETTFAKLPKYIQVNCTFVYIGDRLPSSTQKHFDVPWVGEKKYQSDLVTILSSTNNPLNEFLNAEDAANFIDLNL